MKNFNRMVGVLLVSFCFAVSQPIGWFMEHGYLTNQFKSKTAFFWAHPLQVQRQNDLMNVAIGNSTCRAIHANLVSRHAARYPSIDTIHDFTKLHQKIKGSYMNKNFSFVDKWINAYPEENENMVTQLGQYEMNYLGTLYGVRLHDLFKPGFFPNGSFTDRLKFAATHKTRTQTSAKIFSSWLSEVVTGYNTSVEHVPVRDHVLGFFDNCMSYEQATSEKREMVNFDKGFYFQNLNNNVVDRLQLNTTLTVDDVKSLYELCATELAVENNSDWCTLLSQEDLDVLQYSSDIEDNIERGYGTPITGQMSCPLATDIFTTLDSVIQDMQYDYQNHTLGVFQFGHSDTVVDFFTGLGLYKDTLPLTANNYELLRHRKFNTAKISPFSTHLVFILYQCGGTSPDNYAVKLLVNGEPQKFPGFSSDISRYQDVRQHYSHLIEGCNRDKLCQEGTVPGATVG